ncbi:MULTISPECIES: hypothetical protein [Paenibacillus]|uniref:hypothetical protein n=1 Tax=Paenibacillus TaxID=44249 RepID=UPI0002F9F86C|nr:MULTISPECIES: hypothetical protein [Paenibacillus]
MIDAERLSNLIDKYIIDDGMDYDSAHAKAWKIVSTENTEREQQRVSDIASRSVVI